MQASNVVHKGFVTECRKGMVSRSKTRRLWLVLTSDGHLTLFADRRARTADKITAVDLLSGAHCSPPEECDELGPWTHASDPACRFEIITSSKVLFFEAKASDKCAEWVTHLTHMRASAAVGIVVGMPTSKAKSAPLATGVAHSHAPVRSPAATRARTPAAPPADTAPVLPPAQPAGPTCDGSLINFRDRAHESVGNVEALLVGDPHVIPVLSVLFLRDTAMRHVAADVTSTLPLAAISMAFAAAVKKRLPLLCEHRDEAEALSHCVTKLLRHSDAVLLACYAPCDAALHSDVQGLCDIMLVAFRAVVQMAAKHTGRSVLDIKPKAVTLGDVSTMMRIAHCTVAFIVDQPRDVPATGQQKVPAPLQALPAGDDALCFWRKHNFGADVGVQRLLERLLDVDSALSMTFDHFSALRALFSGPTDADTTQIELFAAFLGQSTSIVAALRLFVSADALSGTPGENTSSVPLACSRRNLLRPIDFGADLVRLWTAHTPGTRRWLMDAVLEWAALPAASHRRRMFWLQGAPGFGKSVVAAQLVKHHGHAVPGDGGMWVAVHFFCNAGDVARNSAVRAIATLAFRLAAQLPAVAVELDMLLSDSARRGQVHALVNAENADMKEAFSLLLAQPLRRACLARDIVVLFDGIDEMPNGPQRVAFLTLVSDLLPSLPTTVRFIVTSRCDSDIFAALNKLTPLVMPKNDALQAADIRLHLQQEAVTKTSLRWCSHASQDAAVSHMLTSADGVFVAATLMAKIVHADVTPWGLTRVQETFVGRGAHCADAMILGVLDRAKASLDAVAVGDLELASVLLTTLRRVLNVLVAAARPVTAAELAILCSGTGHAHSQVTARSLMRLLLPLFGATDGIFPLEPCHAIVLDFFRDEKRAGSAWLVDEGAGHSTLALACLQLRELKIKNAARDYVTQFTATHLAECARRGLRDARHKACAATVQDWLVSLGLPGAEVSAQPKATSHHDVRLLEAAAQILEQLGEYALSLAWYVVVARVVTVDRRRMQLLLRIADVAGLAGDAQQRRVALTDAVAMLDKAAEAGKKIDRVAQTAVWGQLAAHLLQQGAYAQALELFQKIVAVKQGMFGDTHGSLPATYVSMAAVYRRTGESGLALESYGKALAIKQHLYGPQHASIAATLANMANIYESLGEHARALELYNQVLVVRQASLGEKHPDTVSACVRIGNVYRANGDYTQALEYYGRALATRQETLGEHHVDTAAVYVNMAAVYNCLGDHGRALERYGQALTVQLAVMGAVDPGTAGTYNNMGALYYATGDLPHALELFDKALAIRRTVLGEKHPDTAGTYNNMSAVYFGMGDFPRALELCRQALAIQQLALGDAHPNTAGTQFNLAIVYKAMGDVNSAVDHFTIAHAVYAHVYGADHDETRDAATCRDDAQHLLRYGVPATPALGAAGSFRF